MQEKLDTDGITERVEAVIEKCYQKPVSEITLQLSAKNPELQRVGRRPRYTP